MQIEFTKEQYGNLLKLVYCWNMMINWPRLYEDRIKEIDDISSYFYSKAKDFWCEDSVDYWEKEKKYVASREIESDDEISDYMTNYDENNDTFWETLTALLAQRDYDDKYKNPLFEKNYEILDKIFDFYEKEFEKNWIKNLKLDKAKSK